MDPCLPKTHAAFPPNHPSPTVNQTPSVPPSPRASSNGAAQVRRHDRHAPRRRRRTQHRRTGGHRASVTPGQGVEGQKPGEEAGGSAEPARRGVATRDPRRARGTPHRRFQEPGDPWRAVKHVTQEFWGGEKQGGGKQHNPERTTLNQLIHFQTHL